MGAALPSSTASDTLLRAVLRLVNQLGSGRGVMS
jgi:hypothetical protein